MLHRILSSVSFISACILWWSGSIPSQQKLVIHCNDSTCIITPATGKNGKPVLRVEVYLAGSRVAGSSWKLDHPMYKFLKGDINHDGREDILAGVINRTRFDSTLGKRIFIFKLYEGFIRPMWLGSRVSQPLEDFEFVNGNIRTIERERNGNFLVAEYRWKGFGLDFVRYIQRNISLQSANQQIRI